MTASPLGRIVEIAGDGRHLAKTRGFMTVSTGGVALGRVPLDDIAAVITTGHGATISMSLLADLACRGTPTVLCGANFAPAAILWPLEGHHQQQRRMEAQLAVRRPLAKQLWARIVAAKIRAQADAVKAAGRPSERLYHLAAHVRSGDPENFEAQAAKIYWPLLMGSEFRRNTEGPGINAALNYAYAVLRSATARAIVAAGLHPGLGIFHRHPNNSMPLADDLMEPFRPVMDTAVHAFLALHPPEITPAAKSHFVAVLSMDHDTPEGHTPLSTIIIRFAASVAESFLAGKPLLYLPRLRPAIGAPVIVLADEL